ncbi:unnamed protein product [Linum trigynum]|uniref:Uncharacterized protein n=1 Tax=Linum trigynum TaxID=586398 RepID=A0AAV2CCQ7_9ROSI
MRTARLLEYPLVSFFPHIPTDRMSGTGDEPGVNTFQIRFIVIDNAGDISRRQVRTNNVSKHLFPHSPGEAALHHDMIG